MEEKPILSSSSHYKVHKNDAVKFFKRQNPIDAAHIFWLPMEEVASIVMTAHYWFSTDRHYKFFDFRASTNKILVC